MAIATLFYALFILVLISKSIVSIYIASTLLGIAASFLWTGQNSYLVRAATDDDLGTSAGFFKMLFSFGSAVGLITLGFLIPKISYEFSFFLAALLPLVGLLLILQLKDLRSEKSENRFRLLRQAAMSKTMWQLSTIWFSVYFVFGLTIGIIPLEIKNTLGVSYIGSLSSLSYVMPVLLSYGLGRLSDVRGRKALLLFAFLISFLGLVSLYFSHNVLLLMVGVALAALYSSIVDPMTLALVGDVSTKKNLEYLTSFFWMVQNVGVVSALILPTFIQTKVIYLISIAALSLCLLIVFPLLKASFQQLKQRISLEVG
jgi:MFS family permease